MSALALILNPAVDFIAPHARTEIGQVKRQPSRGHGYRVRSIQTEEPNAGLALRRHIGPNVQFRKRGEPWQRRRPTQSHSRHAKRHNSEPRLPLECVDFKFRWNVRAQLGLIHLPMCKQKVVPRLRHDPRLGRQRPRPMRSAIKYGRHQMQRATLDSLARSIYPSEAPKNRILWITNRSKASNQSEGEIACNAKQVLSGRATSRPAKARFPLTAAPSSKRSIPLARVSKTV